MARRKIKDEPVETKAPIPQARFYVHDRDFNPAGYMCEGVEFMRNKGESDFELRKRCLDSVTWPDSQTQNTFVPL